MGSTFRSQTSSFNNMITTNSIWMAVYLFSTYFERKPQELIDLFQPNRIY